MAEERVQRRLAAILASDVVGYSRMMSSDEHGTLARLRSLRSEVFDPAISTFGGRIFKTTGDGALAEFASAVDAVQCSVEIQRALGQRNAEADEEQRMVLRIGISLGDVVVDDDDLYGNGVNVAARMEGLAETGGICISGNVQEQIANTLDVRVEDLGEQSVKNIDRPIRCYRVHLTRTEIAETSAPLALPDKPSIAVLPFENMSGNPEEDYLGDGLTEDIITGISRIRSFFVIARNSTFSYKGKSPDVRQVSADLGVRYVVEGSVRKAGNRVRVTVQLIDGGSGNHLWADRQDRDLDDIFAVQDEITGAIVAQLEPELGRAEYERVRLLPPDNLDAWELYHRGIARYQEWTENTNSEARQLFEHAVDRDENFAPAYAGISWTHQQDWFYLGPRADLDAALDYAQKAVALDDKNAFCHVALGRAYHLNNDPEAARSACETALALNPSLVSAYFTMGFVHMRLKQASQAVEYLEQALRLSPFDPERSVFEGRLAGANFCSGNYDVALTVARNAARGWKHWIPLVIIVGSLANLNRAEELQPAIGELNDFVNGFTIEFARNNLPPWHPDYVQMVLNALSKAGLPEQLTLPPLPDKPSIAVLPFENMSGDREQEYFADGITEDIITALSKFRAFPVIARNSTFTYKNSTPDIRVVGEELGARYIVEGSVRKAGNRVRVTAQLINAETGHHLWAERYDRELEDIFALQDEITERIAGIIEPAIEQTERRRIVTKPPSDLAAWEYWLRGYEYIYDGTMEGNEKARKLFLQAIELDPQYARAHTGLAYTYIKDIRYSESKDWPELIERLFEASRRAVALDETDSEARTMLARAYLFSGDFESALTEVRRAVDLNPNRAFSNNVMCAHLAFFGHFEEAIPWGERAIQLNPIDPQNYLFFIHLALAQLGAGHYEKAAKLTRDALGRQPGVNEAHIILASALGYLGQAEEAASAIEPYRDKALEFIESRTYYADVTKECVLNGLRKAGISE